MFKTRLLSGIVLVLVAFGTLFYGDFLLAAILLLISCVGYLELTKACKVRKEGEKINALEIVGLVGTIAYYAGVYVQADFVLLAMIATFTFIGTLFVYVFTFPAYHSNQVMSSYFAFIYAPVMLSFIYQTRSLQYGSYLVWLIFLASWGCDTCAYCVGMIFGKTIGNHQMSPRLSPKKSIEGAVGGVVGAALLGLLFAHAVLPEGAMGVRADVLFAGICAIGGLISMVGDLAASAIKRNHEIKDYGKCIPGHGGIMDRFDSVIITAPIIFFLAFCLL